MGLEGDLASFTLPDVLSLLSMTSKTGVLQLVRGEITGGVWLRDGVVVSASADDAASALARRIVNAGLVTPQLLEQALTAEGSLAEALCRAADLDAAAVQQLAEEQVKDAILELLRWGSGSFSFEPASVPNGASEVALTASDLVAEEKLRANSWEALAKSVPADDVVLALNLQAGAPGTVTEEEWTLLALIDGHRAVRDVLALSEHGAFHSMTILSGLCSRRLVVPADEAGSARLRADMQAKIGGQPSAPAVAEHDAPSPPVTLAPAPTEPEALTPVANVEPAAPADPAVEAAPARVGVAASLAELAAAMDAVEDGPASNLESEPAASVPPSPTEDGVDAALLQQLMAGVRAV